MSSEDYKKSYNIQMDEWSSIVRDSALLLQLAHQKNWSEMLSLHEKRDNKLKQFFNQALVQDLVDAVQDDLEKIKAQDLEIVQLVKKNQDELSAEAQQLNMMKKRINDYLSAEKNKL